MRGSVRRWLRGRVAVWFHGAFRVPVPALARRGMPLDRAQEVLTWALDRDVVAAKDVYTAPECPWAWIAAVHAPEYLATLDDADTVRRIVGVNDAVVPVGSIVAMWRRAAGAVVAATRHVLARPGRRAAVLSGGFHHAGPAWGGGFCGVNDVAVAIRRVRDDGYRGTIVILDVDAHPPDGTAACVASDEATHLISISVASDWAVAPGPRVLDLRVPGGADDAAYAVALGEALAALARAEPALVFVLAGADPLVGDPLGGLACTEDGLRARDRAIVGACGGASIVVVPAGGYTEGAWRVMAGALAELAGDRRAVPVGYDPLARRVAAIGRRLDPELLGLPPTDGLLRDDDLAGLLGYGPPSEPRLLGAYTQQGLEYGLQRYGLWTALERMGFVGLTLTLHVDREPHRLVVTADGPDGPMRLVDLALSIRVVRDVSVLFVDWCELRDPRRAGALLPGQEHPGLGLARETGALLHQVARRLHLAGVMVIPAFFHVLWAGRDAFVLLDPELRGAFRALCGWAGAVGVGYATRALADGLTLNDGTTLRWTPSEALAPVDSRGTELVSVGEEQAREAEVRLTALLPRDADGTGQP